MFDQKSTTSERKAFLEALLEEEATEDEVSLSIPFFTHCVATHTCIYLFVPADLYLYLLSYIVSKCALLPSCVYFFALLPSHLQFFCLPRPLPFPLPLYMMFQEEDEVPDDEQLNDMIARNEEELELFIVSELTVFVLYCANRSRTLSLLLLQFDFKPFFAT